MMGLSITFAQLEREIWAKGFQEGFQEGLGEGFQEKRLEIAERMLQANVPLETIAQVTGFPMEQLRQIQGDLPQVEGCEQEDPRHF
jgi:predicted transposase/invertase (TIGR01784 family)